MPGIEKEKGNDEVLNFYPIMIIVEARRDNLSFSVKDPCSSNLKSSSWMRPLSMRINKFSRRLKKEGCVHDALAPSPLAANVDLVSSGEVVVEGGDPTMASGPPSISARTLHNH
jgi:hypothetical protein